MARLIFSPTSTTLSPTTRLFPKSLSFTTTSHPSSNLRFKFHPKPFCLSTNISTISVGDNVPEAGFSYTDSTGEPQHTTTSDLVKGKKAIFFYLPNNITPTPSQLPSFVEKAAELKAKGVDTIACVCFKDAKELKEWKEKMNVGDEVLFLNDEDGDLSVPILAYDDLPIGVSTRMRRFSLFADDGVIKVLILDEAGSFSESTSEEILKAV